jgi:Uma2 family endonuclease
MSLAPAEEEVMLGLESAGLLMTPEEFDAIDDYDENYRYELVNGVLVVTPIPLAAETGPNEFLGHLLLHYQQCHPKGGALDYTLPQQYVRTPTSRRTADRLIWTGLGRLPKRLQDLPTIAVEFVSAGRRNQRRDYVDKRREYMQAGIREYWIIDRFQRTLTVIHHQPTGSREQVIRETRTYQSRLLPGFKLPLAQLLASADRFAEATGA